MNMNGENRPDGANGADRFNCYGDPGCGDVERCEHCNHAGDFEQKGGKEAKGTDAVKIEPRGLRALREQARPMYRQMTKALVPFPAPPVRPVVVEVPPRRPSPFRLVARAEVASVEEAADRWAAEYYSAEAHEARLGAMAAMRAREVRSARGKMALAFYARLVAAPLQDALNDCRQRIKELEAEKEVLELQVRELVRGDSEGTGGLESRAERVAGLKK